MTLESLEKLKSGFFGDDGSVGCSNTYAIKLANAIQAEVDEKYETVRTAKVSRSKDGDEAYPVYDWRCEACGNSFWDCDVTSAKYCPHCGRKLEIVDSQEIIDDEVNDLIFQHTNSGEHRSALFEGFFALLARQRKLDGVE